MKTAVERTHLQEVFGRLIGNLSKGYRQRVGLAQAIIGGPDTIILDEPTVGLDPKQIIEIRKLIRDLASEHTVILSSHILSEVQEVCDHIIIINKGKVVAAGTPAELEQQFGSTNVELTLKTDDLTRTKEIMFSIPGVTGVACRLKPGGVETNVRLQVNAGRDIREAVFRKCAETGLPLLMLKAAEFSLESIFLEATEEDSRGSGKKKKAPNKGTEAKK